MDDVSAKQLFAKTGITLGEVLADRYQIIEVLGQGGMGTVFKAINLALNKPVAVKVLHMSLDNFAAARFQQEIKAMSMLSHPHLISVLDAGTTPGGTPYFVMEFLDGPSLGDMLQKHGVPPDVRAIRMFIQMADALAYAHEQGIIHRDLKPNNVVVLSNRGKDFIKLVDLGIAKLVAPGDGAQGLTMTGEIFGSPIYMSPEQCSGRPIDARSDIYSLGCLMFETICGQPPIKGGSALETFNLHVTTDAPLISTVPGVYMTPPLKALEVVIARCVQRAPENRFQSMEELSQALEQIDRTGSYSPNSFSAPVSNFPQASSSAALSNPSPSPTIHADSDTTLSARGEGWAQQNRNEAPNNGHAEHYYESSNQAPRSNSRSSKTSNYGTAANKSFLQNKSLLVGVGTFVVVMALASPFLFFRKAPPPPVPVPTFVQNTPSYQNQVSIQKQLQTIADNQLSQHSTVSYPASNSQSKVEVVAVYMGKDQEAGNEKLPGNVEVDVKYSDKPITLVLTSYMPTNWKIVRDGPDVKIDRVLVSSYKSPITVTGVSPGVPIEKSWYQYLGEDGHHLERARTDNAFEFFTMGASLVPGASDLDNQSDFQHMKKVVEAHLHQPIKTFQGAYRESRFTVR